MRRVLKGLVVVLAIVIGASVLGALAVNQVSAAPVTGGLLKVATCPEGGGWVKVDGLSGTTYTYNAPAGYVITAWCYKASTTVMSGEVDPPATTVTVTSTVTNHRGKIQDLSHASFLLEEEEYEVCEETEAVYGQWSEWGVDPENLSQEVRSRSITYIDSEDQETVCGRDIEYQYRPRQTCVETYAVYGDWSSWEVDPSDLSQEVRSRSVTFVDSVDHTTSCGGDVQYEYRPRVVCVETTVAYGEWSGWAVDPSNPEQEVRSRTVTELDAIDGETVCGSDVEYEYRNTERPLCETTFTLYGDWSEWSIDPSNPLQEVRSRIVLEIDAVDGTTQCGSDYEYEYRPIVVPVCENPVPVYGEWSEWTIDPNNPGQEFRTRTVTFVDGQTVCGSTVETQYRDLTLVPYCMPDGTTVWVPAGQDPPEGAVEGQCVKEPWVKKTPPVCPACGPRVEEVGGPDDLVISWYSRGECIVNLKKWCIEVTDPFIYLRAEHPFSVLVSQGEKVVIKYNEKLAKENETASFPTPLVAYHSQLSATSKLTYLDASPFVGVDGKTYFILDVPRELTGGYLVLYDGSGARWREVYGKGTVKSWVSCSRTVGPWDIPEDGIVRKDLFGGPVDWDWEKFLVDEGYVDSWAEAHEWLLDFYATGEKALPSK